MKTVEICNTKVLILVPGDMTYDTSKGLKFPFNSWSHTKESNRAFELCDVVLFIDGNQFTVLADRAYYARKVLQRRNRIKLLLKAGL